MSGEKLGIIPRGIVDLTRFLPPSQLDPNTYQPFNDSTKAVEIGEPERLLGPSLHKDFITTVQRRLPWVIQSNGLLTRFNDRGKILLPDGREAAVAQSGNIIDLNKIDKEKLSFTTAQATRVFRDVEIFLPDFTRQLITVFRNVRGLRESTYQWGNEEGNHTEGLGEILVRTGNMREDELDESINNRLKNTWELPFKSGIEMLAYAVLQERMTAAYYYSMMRRAQAENAPTVAEVFSIIGQDETWHGRGYEIFYNTIANLYPEEAKKAMLHVASHFRMPAQNLLRNKRDMLWVIKAGFTEDEFQQSIYHSLIRFSFINKGEAKKASEECMENLKAA